MPKLTKYVFNNKCISDEDILNFKNKYLTAEMVKYRISKNCEVYFNDRLLLKFRKNILNEEKRDAFYNNVISFANQSTNNRGSVSNSSSKNVHENPKIKSNIIGYFDTFSTQQKYLAKNKGITFNHSVRETSFLNNHRDKYLELLPLTQEVNELYSLLCPEQYEKQLAKAEDTPFHIENTAFSTITTNVNFQTCHQDSGNFKEGFSALTVLEEGEYNGGELAFPQYGFSIDIR
jgi:hypothetical protein